MLGNRSKAAIKSAVYKATDHKAAPSKEKHVRAIILRTFSKDKDNSVDQIIRYLSLRLEKTNWAVVLKCLMIFHRCFRDGDASFMESMKTRSNHIFALQKFSATAPATHLYTVFVKKYAKYLEEKVSVLRLLTFQFEKNKDAVKNLKAPKCFKIVPKLQSQLNALLNCKMRSQHVGQNQLIHRTYILIMKDSLTLYTMLNDAVLQLLDLFWKMKKKDAQKVVSIYKLFVKETDALIGLYEIGKRFVRQLPEIKKAETSVIESMEKHAENLPDDDSSDEASSEKSTGKKTKHKKHSSKKKKSSESSEGAELKEGEEEEYDEYEDKNSKYDDDSEEGDQSSSGEEGEEMDDGFTFPSAFPPQTIAPFVPTFGPGAQVMHPQEPSYQEKANFIKQISAVTDPSYGAHTGMGGHPFASGGAVVNPFGGGVQQPATLSNPFQGGAGGGGGGGGNPFGAVSNPFAITPQPNNNFSGNNPGFNPGANPNVFGGGNAGYNFNNQPPNNFNPAPNNNFNQAPNNNFNPAPNNYGSGGNAMGHGMGGNAFGSNPMGNPMGSGGHNSGGMHVGVNFNANAGATGQNPFGGNAVTNPFL